MPKRTESHPPQNDPVKEWSRHEHVAPTVQNEAQRLVVKSGSPELAKQDIDAAAQAPPPVASTKEAFTREHGFTSYLELLEASTGVRTTDGKNWCLTAQPGGKWMAWNEQDLSAHSLHASVEAARQAIPQR